MSVCTAMSATADLALDAFVQIWIHIGDLLRIALQLLTQIFHGHLTGSPTISQIFGRRDDALDAIVESLDLRRRLTADHTAAFNEGLARSLYSHSNRL
jgi:hypothetical protein